MASTWGLSFSGSCEKPLEVTLNGGSYLSDPCYEFRLQYLAVTPSVTPFSLDSKFVAVTTNLNSSVPYIALLDANVFTTGDARVVEFPEVWYKLTRKHVTHARFSFVNPATKSTISLMLDRHNYAEATSGSSTSSEASDFVVVQRERRQIPLGQLPPQVTMQVLFRPAQMVVLA